MESQRNSRSFTFFQNIFFDLYYNLALGNKQTSETINWGRNYFKLQKFVRERLKLLKILESLEKLDIASRFIDRICKQKDPKNSIFVRKNENLNDFLSITLIFITNLF